MRNLAAVKAAAREAQMNEDIELAGIAIGGLWEFVRDLPRLVRERFEMERCIRALRGRNAELLKRTVPLSIRAQACMRLDDKDVRSELLKSLNVIDGPISAIGKVNTVRVILQKLLGVEPVGKVMAPVKGGFALRDAKAIDADKDNTRLSDVTSMGDL